MNTDLARQYYQQERLRRQALYRQYYIKLNNINVIRNYILAGGNPATNPDLSAEYFVLVSEGAFSQDELSVFNAESADGMALIREEDEYPSK